MDRLFLQALASELRPKVVGRRVRTAVVDRPASRIALSLSPTTSVCWSLLPEAAGPFLAEPVRSGATTPGLKKRVVSAAIVELETSGLDRVVTMTLEQTRISGRTTRSELVLEVIGNRVGLYLVDSESSAIVEAFGGRSSGRAPGERYEPPRAPPTAAPEAANVGEFEKRRAENASSSLPRRSLLLAATGFSPLVVGEMEWLVDEKGVSEAEAFAGVRARLDARRPVLYRAREAAASRGTPLLLSPIELESKAELEPRFFESFSSALATAVDLSLRARRVGAARARLDSAVSRRLEKMRRLRSRLREDRASLEDPAELRLRGEKLLAGMSRARRSGDGRMVVVPDSFDAEGRPVEIPVDPRLTLAANAERFFSRARKSERARVEIDERLDSLEAPIAYWEAFECDSRDARELSELEALEEEARGEGLLFEERRGKPGRSPRGGLGPRRYRSRGGNVILVGRSGRSNDETTFRIAGPGDLWFHAAGIPGAHVVLRPAPGVAVDEGEIEEAASLAAYFSKGREDTRVDVLVTERRNVSKIKGGPPGLVKVQKARTIRVSPRLLDEEGSR